MNHKVEKFFALTLARSSIGKNSAGQNDVTFGARVPTIVFPTYIIPQNYSPRLPSNTRSLRLSALGSDVEIYLFPRHAQICRTDVICQRQIPIENVRPSDEQRRYISRYIVRPPRARKAKREKRKKERKEYWRAREEMNPPLLESFPPPPPPFVLASAIILVIVAKYRRRITGGRADSTRLLFIASSARARATDIPKYTKPGNIAICRFDGNCIHAAHRSNAPPRIN